MFLSVSFPKRAKRYVGAVIATAVTTFIAINTLSAEAQTCTIHDATRWQLTLNDLSVEQTPEHIRSVTEAFLNGCPERPEFYEASRIAAIAAADMGDAHAASKHFRNAGSMRDLTANFYAMSSYLAAGQGTDAWRLRDRTVESWRNQLDRHPHVLVSAEAVENGMIYQVHFAQPDTTSGTRAAWVAVPYDAGWPATLSFSRDRFRLAVRRTRAVAEPENVQYVDLHRCQGRRALGRLDRQLSATEFDTAARASLAAYLANPDQPEAQASAAIKPCLWPTRLLPGIPKP